MAYNTESFYAIFLTHFYYSCGVTYKSIVDYKVQSYKDRDNRIQYRRVESPLHLEMRGTYKPDFINAVLTFSTAEDAMAKVKELVKDGVLPANVRIKIGGTPEYGSTADVISILQRPLSDIVGSYRAFALTFAEEHPDFEYDNEHRYQVRRSRMGKAEYAVYDKNTNTIEWSADRTKASLFNENEQARIIEQANNIKPFNGYCQAQNLPAIHAHQPHFKRGDIVSYTKCGKVCHDMVYDVLGLNDGWHYEVGSDYHQGGWSIVEENFFETSPFTDLFHEDELKPSAKTYEEIINGR